MMMLRTLVTALLVWLTQFLAVLYGVRERASGPWSMSAAEWADALRSFKCWDSVWYEAITDYGYWKALPFVTPYGGAQTVAWFPGFPLVGRGVQWLLGLDTQLALMVTAALASLLFWLYVAAIFEGLTLRWPFKLLAALLIASHPSAFFMFSEYSESLFLAMTLGFCFWVWKAGDGTSRLRWAMAAAHGFGASATRLIGIPQAGIALGLGFFSRPRALSKRASVSVVSATGGLAFFAFLHARFGNWRLYMDTQSANWGIHPSFWALFTPSSYRICTQDLSDSGCLSQTSVPLTLLLMVGAFFLLGLCRSRKGFKLSLALLGSAAICFAVSVMGLASRDMISMIRYTFPPYVFSILAICICASELKALGRGRFVLYLALLVAALVLCDTQVVLLRRFVSFGWVA